MTLFLCESKTCNTLLIGFKIQLTVAGKKIHFCDNLTDYKTIVLLVLTNFVISATKSTVDWVTK